MILSLVLAWRFEGLEGAARGAPIRLHKSVGITLLALVAARLVWRLARPPPPFPTEMPRREQVAARAVHWSFYLLLIAQPLVGWAMISADAEGRVTRLWGAVGWPRIKVLAELPPPVRDSVHAALAAAHLWLGLLLVALIGVHVLAALKHRLFDRPHLPPRMPPF